MEIVVEVMKRRPILLQCMHHLGEAVGPQPSGVDRLELFPATGAISPDLETSGVPTTPTEVGGAFGAVDLEGWRAVALNAVTGMRGDHGAALLAWQHVEDSCPC